MIVSHVSGIDSYIANAIANDKYGETTPVYYDYGQPFFHKEYDVLKELIGLSLKTVRYCDSTHIPFKSNCDLPGRDMVMCLYSAVELEADMIVVGTSPDDIYNDTTPEYFFFLEKTLSELMGKKIQIVRPLFDLGLKKSEAIKKALDMGIKQETLLSLPSCNEDTDGPCLKCSKCCFNWASFSVNGIDYPSVLEAEEGRAIVLDRVQYSNDIFIDSYNKYNNSNLDVEGIIKELEL